MKQYRLLGYDTKLDLSDDVTDLLNTKQPWVLYGPPIVIFDGETFHYFQAMVSDEE